MRQLLIVLSMLLCPVNAAIAQVSFGIGVPGVSIGINLPVYPQLVAVPGYPVYYAPQVNSNYFFYDGAYWVYQRDNWYASSWYNGPWGLVAPEAIPLFVLRVPVRYYRQPPAYFHGWRSDAPPRWGEHWGNSWSQSHEGWDNWNRASSPPPAPLPVYQRQYTGSRYPRPEQQPVLQSQNYRYQPHEAVVQQHYESQRVQSAPAFSAPLQMRDFGRSTSSQLNASPAPRGPAPQAGNTNVARPPVQAPSQQMVPTAQRTPQPQSQTVQHETRTSVSQGPNQKPAGKPVPQQSNSGGQGPPSSQAAAHRDPHAPESHGQDKGSQGKGTPQDARQGHEKGDQKGGEHGK